MGKVAAVQMTSTDNLYQNLDSITRWVKEAAEKEAELVILPENAAFMGLQEADKFKIAEKEGHGTIQDCLSSLAREHNIWIVGGTLPLLSEHEKYVFSACLVWDNTGHQIARYDKIHLFDVIVNRETESYLESSTVKAGQEPVSCDTPLGKLGLTICYDLRFPELYRKLFDAGVKLFAVPSAFTAVTGKAHWEILLRARAIENFSYVIAPNQGGIHSNGRATWGHSMIIDPWGTVMALAEEEGVIIAKVDLSYLSDIRERFPIASHRKIF